MSERGPGGCGGDRGGAAGGGATSRSRPRADPAPPQAAGASDIERLLGAFCSQGEAVVEAARRLLSDERAPRRQKLLADLIHNLSENILAEDRAQDSGWFEGASVARGQLLGGPAARSARRSRFCQLYSY